MAEFVAGTETGQQHGTDKPRNFSALSACSAVNLASTVHVE